MPEEVNGTSLNFVNPLTDVTATIRPMYTNPSNGNLAPPVGMASDPTGDGRMSLRGGFGVFFDPLWTDFYANAGNRLGPFYTLGSVRIRSFRMHGESRYGSCTCTHSSPNSDFGDRSSRMIRGGICYSGKVIPESFAAQVDEPG